MKRLGNGDYRPLDISQYRVVLKVGIHKYPPGDYADGVEMDYHFWYQTKDGTWANKHGTNAPVHLSSGTTPSSTQTSGWNYEEYENFYDSELFCFIVTIN